MTTAILVGNLVSQTLSRATKTAQAVKHDLATIWNSRSELVSNGHGGQTVNPNHIQHDTQVLHVPKKLWDWL